MPEAFFILSAITCLSAGVASLFISARSVATRLFSVGMVWFALEQTCNALSIHRGPESQFVYWQKMKMYMLVPIPATWLAFSVVYSRGNYLEFLKKWRITILLMSGISLGLAILFSSQFVNPFGVSMEGTPQSWQLTLGAAGNAMQLTFVVAIVLILVNFERTFRYSLGTLRWKIKWVILGLSVLFLTRLFTCSQSILYSRVMMSLEFFNAASNLIAGVLILISIKRSGEFNVDIYPSHSIIKNSIILLLAGLYLFIVGILAQIFSQNANPSYLLLRSLFVLMALVFLGVLLLSDRFHQRLRHFISRHFGRPMYDHRKEWTTFVQQTVSVMDARLLCGEFIKILSDTFQVLSLTVWLKSENEAGYGKFASSIEDGIVQSIPNKLGSEDNPLLTTLFDRQEPLVFNPKDEGKIAELARQYHSDFFRKDGSQVWAALQAKQDKLGVVAIGDRVYGQTYSTEELGLLKIMCDQISASLLSIKLSEKLLASREFEAFQTMSTFFVHDLKNVASSMSIMLKNFTKHYDDPEFRADALKGIGRNLDRLNHLIERLTLLRKDPKVNFQQTNLNQILLESCREAPFGPGMRLVTELKSDQSVYCDPEQVRKVFSNLLLNAIEAVTSDGIIHVSTQSMMDGCEIVFRDNGCGMSRDFIEESLFKPFQTTKRNGMGIGMFHCKRIIEMHHGKILVDSTLGEGTAMVVYLPLHKENT